MSEPIQTLEVWTGHKVLDTTGAKIGTIQDVRFDEAVKEPEWLVVKTGLFGTKRVFVPARDVRIYDDKLIVPYTQERAKDAPHVARNDALSVREERDLYRYYGLEYPAPSSTVAADSKTHES